MTAIDYEGTAMQERTRGGLKAGKWNRRFTYFLVVAELAALAFILPPAMVSALHFIVG